MSDERVSTAVQIRFRDLDSLSHVNNAVYTTYLEEARIAYNKEVLDLTPGEYTFVIANVEISFTRPIEYGEEVEIFIEAVAIGETSWTSEYEVYGDGELAATGESTRVVLDPETMEPTRVPDDIRNAITEFEGL
ncbi:MAG: thioesterase family protein [Natrialbaceae archaeon]|nr:thioesterase family protein [Natrialbaceae archaeon]